MPTPTIYGRYPSSSWKPPVATAAALPATGNTNGDARVTLDTDEIYVWDGVGWLPVASPAAVTAITALLNTSDVTANGPGAVPATVNSVGGKSAAQIAQSVTDTQAATSSNTPNTIVKRDGSGNFSAGTITASLTGVASGNVTSVSASSPLSSSGGFTPNITIQQATSIQNGYLSSTDWSTFNNKQAGPLTGDVTTSGAIATISNNVVSNSKLAQAPANTIKGNNTGSTANEQDLTVSQVNVMLGDVTTIGTIDSQTAQANGLDIVGNTLYAQSASTSNPGMVNNTTQSFSGNKTFTGTIAASNFSGSSSGTNTGDVTLAAFDASPNANGASLSGQVLTLQPADATHPGGVSITTQTIAGNKTLTGNTLIAQSAASKATIGASSSTAIHQINGGINYTTITITASTYTVDNTTTDYIIYTDSTSNAITITLPVPTNGRTLIVQDKTGQSGTNNITIKQNAAETISGLTQYVLARAYIGVTLTSDGTNWTAIKVSDSGQSFITSGITYTTPVNITPQTRFKFTCIGGGGGGGGFSATGASASGGGGSGGGILFITGLAANTAYTIAIGGGGTGGIATTPGNAGNGGNTTLTIGATTYTAHGGTGSGGGSTNSDGGAGGAATNFTINITGRNGNGADNNNPTALGMGGDAPFGLGLGGASRATGGAGFNATGFGGGGGGSHGTAATGGTGSAGCILVEWNN